MRTRTMGKDVMTTTAAAGAPKVAPTTGETLFNYFVFGASTVASAVFAYYLISDPSRLSYAWTWIRTLPLLIQLVMWALLLPWMLALWLWSLPWALPVRIALVIGILGFAEYLVFPWKK